MSRTLTAPRWGMGAVLAGIASLALMALLALGLSPRANAAFTTGKCAGPNIIGEGASFARDAHKVFNNNFKNSYCIGTPRFGSINVQYEAEGSGAGRRSVKFRDRQPRFGMTDDPPTPAEVEQMNAGTGEEPAADDLDPSDNGLVHVVPAAVGAVAPLVNFPDGCDPALLPAAAKATDFGDTDLTRVRFTKEQFEKVWAQGADVGAAAPYVNWDDVFTQLEADADCDEPVIRVVRFDDSGTTFAFKDYLRSIEPARGWHTTFAGGSNETLEWPGAEVGTRTDCPGEPKGPGAEPDATDHLTSGCDNGNGELVPKLIATDGSIGYSDISTARGDGLAIEADPVGEPDNDTYWTQVQNGADVFVEPTASAEGFITEDGDDAFPEGGAKGANCQATEFEGVPSSTLQDWSAASGVNSEVGFGICTMTYGLVFDDNADVWGNLGFAEEEEKARTVKDYWENILSDGSQDRLFDNDYSRLPSNVLPISRAGIASVDWNKGEGGGGGGGGSTPPPPTTTAPAVVTPPPPPPPPSNLFSLLRKQISSGNGQATIAVKVPGAGRLVMVGTARVQVGGRKSKRKNRRVRKRAKTVKVGQVVLNANRAGTFNLKLTPRGAAKRELRKRGKLRVVLRLAYTPVGGTTNTSRSAVVLKLNKKNSRKGRKAKRGQRNGGSRR